MQNYVPSLLSGGKITYNKDISFPVLRKERHNELFRKTSRFCEPAGAAGKLLIASMNIFHTPVSLWGISHLDLAGNEKILDIGCGGGINLSRFLKKVPRGHVAGIDLSPDCVSYSFMRNRDAIAEGRCSVYEGSAELLPFGANHFDVITALKQYTSGPICQTH